MEQITKSVNILAVDDDFGVRESLKMILKDRYNVSVKSNTEDALLYIKDTEPDVIFLDIKMPKVNGLDFLKTLQSVNSFIPVIIITAFPSSQTAITAFRNGAFDYVIKPFETSEIYAVVERAIQHRLKLSENDRLIFNLRRAVSQNFTSTTEALLLVIDAKDSYTAEHSKQVSRLFCFVAEELDIDKTHIEKLRYGTFFHDIGKIGVKDSILTKPGALTVEEFETMKQHSTTGFNILEPIELLKEGLPIVRHHHEWFNGKGYPDGLKGKQIPREVTIFSIVDAYNALTTDRHYRKKYTHEKALEIISENIGTQFDPAITEKVLAQIDKYHKSIQSEEIKYIESTNTFITAPTKTY